MGDRNDAGALGEKAGEAGALALGVRAALHVRAGTLHERVCALHVRAGTLHERVGALHVRAGALHVKGAGALR